MFFVSSYRDNDQKIRKFLLIFIKLNFQCKKILLLQFPQIPLQKNRRIVRIYVE